MPSETVIEEVLHTAGPTRDSTMYAMKQHIEAILAIV